MIRWRDLFARACSATRSVPFEASSPTVNGVPATDNRARLGSSEVLEPSWPDIGRAPRQFRSKRLCCSLDLQAAAGRCRGRVWPA